MPPHAHNGAQPHVSARAAERPDPSVLHWRQAPQKGWNLVPRVTIRTGFRAPDDQEEVLTEYLCDWPGCANVAVHTLGCIAELRAAAAVCEEHIPRQPPPKP